MPELPDVKIFQNYIKRTALNKQVQKTHVVKSKVLKNLSPQKITRFCKGHRIKDIKRIGKYLLFNFTGHDRLLALHFGMTGEIVYEKQSKGLSEHALLSLDFSNNKRLSLIMPRKFGSIELTQSVDDFIKKHNLGPDLMSLTKEDFVEKLINKKGSIKSALMDQSLFAGLGNIYSDEILFQAKIDPDSKLSALNKSQLKKIWQASQEVIKKSIKVKADPEKLPKNFIIPHRKRNEKCPKCKDEIKNKTSAGRSSYYCPKCQKLYK